MLCRIILSGSFLLCAFPVHADVYPPNLQQSQAINRARITLERGIGETHPVSETLRTLYRDHDIFVNTEMDEDTMGITTPNPWNPFDIEIHLREEIVNGAINADFQSYAFWNLLTILLHEGIHATDTCLDPCAALETYDLLRTFLPRPIGAPQPLRAMETLSGQDLFTLYKIITDRMISQARYALSYTFLSVLSGPTGIEAINTAYEAFANELAEIRRISDTFRWERNLQERRLRLRWSAERRSLQREWKVPIPEFPENIRPHYRDAQYTINELTSGLDKLLMTRMPNYAE